MRLLLIIKTKNLSKLSTFAFIIFFIKCMGNGHQTDKQIDMSTLGLTRPRGPRQ